MIWIYLLLIGCVMLSGLGMYLLKVENKNILKFLLAFSAAFLIGISFMHLLPEVYEAHIHFIGAFVLLGFLLQLFLELLTKGAEHGHVHDEEECRKAGHVSPLLLMIGLSIHSFLEGMPIVESFDPHLRNTLVTGIIVHKIPIAVTLFTLFLHYGMSVRKSFLLLFLFALMTPLGSLASWTLQETTVHDMTKYFQYIMAVVVGIFLHVATSILYETDESHQYNFRKFFVIILGLAMAFGVSLIGHGH